MKKSLKSTQQDLDEQMVTDSREVPISGEKGGKKLTKVKGYVGTLLFTVDTDWAMMWLHSNKLLLVLCSGDFI